MHHRTAVERERIITITIEFGSDGGRRDGQLRAIVGCGPRYEAGYRDDLRANYFELSELQNAPVKATAALTRCLRAADVPLPAMKAAAAATATRGGCARVTGDARFAGQSALRGVIFVRRSDYGEERERGRRKRDASSAVAIQISS